jgi:hypothetical protein
MKPSALRIERLLAKVEAGRFKLTLANLVQIVGGISFWRMTGCCGVCATARFLFRASVKWLTGHCQLCSLNSDSSASR